MRFWIISAAIAAGAVVALLGTTPSAQAQSRQYQRGDSTVVYYVDEFGRAPHAHHPAAALLSSMPAPK